MSLAAIVIANVGAPLVVPADSPRLRVSLAEDIEGNLLMLSFVLGVFSVLLHLVLRPGAAAQPMTGGAP